MVSLWIVFAIFAFNYIAKIISIWAVLTAWSLGLSIYLLIKNKFPSIRYIIISFVLALIVALSYLGYTLSFIPQMLISGISCFCASLAVFSVMEKYGDFSLIKTDTKFSPAYSVLIGIGVGIVLGIINYFIGKGSMDTNFEISIPRILLAFNPAIHEEITDRAIFMAFCTYIFTKQNKTPSKFQIFTMWFMMTVPHCFSHGYPVVSSLILLVLFGLPFAFLQRKRDLTSAMIGHGLVDLIRFTMYGIPV